MFLISNSFTINHFNDLISKEKTDFSDVQKTFKRLLLDQRERKHILTVNYA